MDFKPAHRWGFVENVLGVLGLEANTCTVRKLCQRCHIGATLSFRRLRGWTASTSGQGETYADLC